MIRTRQVESIDGRVSISGLQLVCNIARPSRVEEREREKSRC